MVLGQPLVAHRPVDPLDLRVLLGLDGLDELHPDLRIACPIQHRLADVFRSVVAPGRRRLAPPLDQLSQCPSHSLQVQEEFDLDGQRLTVEVVHDFDPPERVPPPPHVSITKSIDQIPLIDWGHARRDRPLAPGACTALRAGSASAPDRSGTRV